MRTVDADAIISRIKPLIEAEQQIFKKGSWRFAEKCLAVVESTPTVDAERKGHWIYGEDEYGIDGYHCDKCGFFVPWDYAHTFINYIEDYNLCPSCGAKMESE